MAAAAAALTRYRFGISRKHGGTHLLDGGEHFVEELGTALRVPVVLQVAPTYRQLWNEVVGGELEIAWLPPLLYMQAIPYGAQLLAVAERGGAAAYRSALLVESESDYQDVADLKGARIAWVDRQSASGYLFPQLHLIARGFDPNRDFASEKFFGSVQLAAAEVVAGAADLCTCFVSEAAGHDAPWGKAQDEIRQTLGNIGLRLRVLEMTDSIPPDGVVAAAHVPPEERARIQEVLFSLHALDFGGDALSALLQAERLVPVPDSVRRSIALARGLPKAR